VNMFDVGKTRMIGLPMVKNYDNMLSRFHLIPEVGTSRTDGQTDRQTDGQNCYINIAHQYADAR